MGDHHLDLGTLTLLRRRKNLNMALRVVVTVGPFLPV
jgi:hypothetical protein